VYVICHSFVSQAIPREGNVDPQSISKTQTNTTLFCLVNISQFVNFSIT